MSLSMYQASIPVFRQKLEVLSGLLRKAEAHAEARKIDPSVLLNYRLAPDMFPLVRQVQIVSDSVKSGAGNLAGVEIPKFEDFESTFAELHERIVKTDAYAAGFKPEQIDGSEEREVVLRLPQVTFTMKGQNYLLNFVMPNFYFHLTAAYAILRHCGVDVGKRDFLGTF